MEARISQSTVGPGEKLCTVILRDVTERKRIEREREDLLARAREAAVEAERANRAKDDVPPPAKDVPLAGLRVLVVDDDPDTLDILVAILATEGMTVRTSHRPRRTRSRW
jgi:PleD family two-component response regulator